MSIIGIALTSGTMLGAFVYPMVRKVMKEKVMLILVGLGLGVYYLALIAAQPLYDSKIFLYVFLAVLNVLVGVFVALASSLFTVEMIRQTDEAYLARVSAIVSSLGSAASPLVAFMVSGIAAFCDTQIIFLATGILALLVSFPLLFSKTLDALDKTPEGKEQEQEAEPAVWQEEISYVAD